VIVFTKGSFYRDVSAVSDGALLEALKDKIKQMETAADMSRITGLKLLKGYQTHYRIKVVAGKASYRIGAIIRTNTIWLVRFLPRKGVYREFP